MKDAGPRPRRVIVIGLGALVGSVALGAVALRSARSSRASEQSMEAREKGRTVRRAIDEASGRLPVGTTADWRDISHVIEPHIPAGTSYDLAEAILWYAGFGFTWSRQTAAKPMDENLKRCPTIAVVRQPILWPIGEREVSVTLVPNLLANFDTVERACAFIRDERWT